MRLAVIGAALAAVVIADSATKEQTSRHNKTPKEAIRNRASNRGPSESS